MASTPSGQLKWVGDYEQCTGVRANYIPIGITPPKQREFSGRYCAAGVRLNIASVLNDVPEVSFLLY